MAGISTHILDTSQGCPAAGVKVELWRGAGVGAVHVSSGVTNADGRLDQPILSGGELTTGNFELRFFVGDYLAALGDAFFGMIPIAFKVDDASQHYHVPLLLSPFSYSTYRGS